MSRLLTTSAALALLTVLVVSTASAAGPLRVLNIQSRVSVNGSEVRLEDLAVNPEILSESERAVVVLALPAGAAAAQRLSLVNLAYTLQQHASLLDINLRGAHWVVVEKAADQRQLQRLKSAISAELAQNAPWNAWTIDITFNDDDERRLGQVGEYSSLEVRVLDSRAMLGNVPLRVTLRNATAETTLLLTPVISRQIEALVLRHTRDRYHVLSAADLEPATIWIGDEKRDYITDAVDCIGTELSRRLTAGELLRRSHCLAPVCAKRGDIVWVTCSTGGLTIRLPVQVLEAGRKGDAVRVRNTSSDKIFSVVLTGAKEARANMGS